MSEEQNTEEKKKRRKEASSNNKTRLDIWNPKRLSSKFIHIR